MGEILFGTWKNKVYRFYAVALHLLAGWAIVDLTCNDELQKTILLYLFVSGVALVVFFWIYKQATRSHRPAQVKPTIKTGVGDNPMHSFDGVWIDLESPIESQFEVIASMKGKGSGAFWDEVGKVYNRNQFRKDHNNHVAGKIRLMAMDQKKLSPSPTV